MSQSEPTKPMSKANPCPQCGVTLPVGALDGLCPACLLQQATQRDSATHPGTAFEPPSVAEVARLFPHLEVSELIGKGGMGAVYKARQPALGRFVALKLLPSQSSAGPASAERFNREARALARLNHPHIVAVHEFGTVAGFHYFLMEHVDGVNLRQLQKGGRLSPREALQLVPQLCDALQYAHDEGVVHRDIKPENVLVDRRGRVKIADFGLAKLLDAPPADERLTVEGQVMGTPHYMAPEQVEHPRDVDHRADIFSLGVVFYELLTGELPLGKFPPPSRKVQVDVRLDEVVLRTLEKEPERRYQQAGEVKTAVQAITDTPEAQSVGETSPPPSTGRDVRTKTTLLGLPLVHVASGRDPATGRRRVAKGIVAVGPTAIGVVAVGYSAFGVIACGLFACGLCSTALLAFGVSAVGLAAAGVEAGGLLALGVHHAAGLVAVGAGAVGPNTVVLGAGLASLLWLALATLAGLAFGRQGPAPTNPPARTWAREPIRRGVATGLLVFLTTVAIASAITALLPRSYMAVARVEVTLRSLADTPKDPAWDPYVIQTEFEVIRSDKVLGRVVADLKLQERWARRFGVGGVLQPAEVVKLLRTAMDERVIRSTALIEIGFYDEQPNEAAEIANAIATAYANFRKGQVRAYEEAKRGGADSVGVDRPARLVDVQIVDRAEPPLKPIRPNPQLNLLVGVVAGLGLGLVVGLLTAIWLAARARRVPSGARDELDQGGRH